MHNLHEINFKMLSEEKRARWCFESLLDDKTLSQDQLALDAGVNQSTISRTMHSPAFLRLLLNDMYDRAVRRVRRAIMDGDGDLKTCQWYLELCIKSGHHAAFVPKTDPGEKARFQTLVDILAGDGTEPEYPDLTEEEIHNLVTHGRSDYTKPPPPPPPAKLIGHKVEKHLDVETYHTWTTRNPVYEGDTTDPKTFVPLDKTEPENPTSG